MARQKVVIKSDSYICIKNKLLSISVNHKPFIALPLEDIGVIILESTRSTITTAALARIMQSGVELVTCGFDHLPNGYLTPISQNCRVSAIATDQISMSLPLKKRIWQRLVQAKIENQVRPSSPFSKWLKNNMKSACVYSVMPRSSLSWILLIKWHSFFK